MNKITLYHYSDKDINDYLDPKYFGDNSYSLNSASISGVKRTYFYTNEYYKECYFRNCHFLYIAELDKNKLYDIAKDTLRLAGKGDIYTETKKRGFEGIIKDNVAVIFNAIKIKNKKDLTR